MSQCLVQQVYLPLHSTVLGTCRDGGVNTGSNTYTGLNKLLMTTGQWATCMSLSINSDGLVMGTVLLAASNSCTKNTIVRGIIHVQFFAAMQTSTTSRTMR
eukprot:scpid54473/ scgid29347/ 